MISHRCDSCKKIIRDRHGDYLEIRMNYKWLEICKDCAQPIMESFEKDSLLPKRVLKSLQPARD